MLRYPRILATSAALCASLAVSGCPRATVEVPVRADAPITEVAPAIPTPDPADAAAEAENARAEAARAEVAARLEAEANAARLVEADRLAFDRDFPLYGVSFQYLAPIRREPSDRASSIGYLRRGSQFRASTRVEGRGCARGWYRLPGDGYVCRGDGVTIGEAPQSFEPSPNPPSLEDALPYAYAYTARRSAPQYFRIPTTDEEAQVNALFTRMEAAEEHAATADAGVRSAPASADAADTVASEGVEAPPPPGATAEAAAPEAEDGLPDFLRMRMLRSFYVSVDGEETSPDGRRFVRTVRGAYVPGAMLTPNQPPTHRGVVLGGTWTLPVGFVYRNGAHHLTRDAVTGALTDLGAIDQHTAFVVRERFARGSTAYLISDQGWAVRESVARVATLTSRPTEVPEGAKWLHIDLSDQILVAYEGDTPVFTTTVSTGRPGFETPTGVFHVQSKHVSTTMDDLAAGAESYSIEDVPWTMYFQGNYALHGAFWHNQFGRVRSHGCVNLAPVDARWLFGWSTPTVPTAWHGVFARNATAGTFVVVVP